MIVSSFDNGVLQAICDVLGDTEHGFTGSEIGRLLSECDILDPRSGQTKRYRLYAALKTKQDADRCGNGIVAFIQTAMSPVRYHSSREWYEDRRSELNHILAFQGYQLGEDGRLRISEQAKTHTQAQARATKLRESLLIRHVHPDVLKYCREELLVDNYFHSVFEATKSVAEKIRQKSGLSSDGSMLVDEAFSFRGQIPHLALNSLQSDSEKSEQTGFMNLLKGLFGTFRNTTAHAPKITWRIGEQDALDILSLISLVHRRLDDAVCARQIAIQGSGKPNVLP